ncbi:MAG: hypothetical protein ACTSX9_01925 [Candidatus Njordarchaeales archaeon]
MSNDYFQGYSYKQFFIVMLAEDPWSYLRTLRIPSEIKVLSGLRGFKRKKTDIETVAIGDKYTGMHILNSDFIVAPIKVPRIKETLIPYIAGSVRKESLIIWRDPHDYHPLYYSRLPDGYIFSSRMEWIWRIGFRSKIFPKEKKALIDKASIYFRNREIQKQSKSALFLQTISRVQKVLKNRVSLNIILLGTPEDIFLLNFLSDIKDSLDNVQLKVLVPDVVNGELQRLTVEDVESIPVNDLTTDENIRRWIELSESSDPGLFLRTSHLLSYRENLVKNTVTNVNVLPIARENNKDKALQWVSFKLLWPALCVFIPPSTRKLAERETIRLRQYMDAWKKYREKLVKELQFKAMEKNLKRVEEYFAIIFKDLFPYTR